MFGWIITCIKRRVLWLLSIKLRLRNRLVVHITIFEFHPIGDSNSLFVGINLVNGFKRRQHAVQHGVRLPYFHQFTKKNFHCKYEQPIFDERLHGSFGHKSFQRVRTECRRCNLFALHIDNTADDKDNRETLISRNSNFN